MALFHKDFHKLLAEHIKQLGKFGELPEMWVWHHDKVIELKEIDEALIEDLNALPSELGESPEALELLKKLQEDLERMLKQRPVADVQKREAKAVNSLIVKIKNVMSKILKHGEINEFFREHHPRLQLKKIIYNTNQRYILCQTY